MTTNGADAVDLSKMEMALPSDVKIGRSPLAPYHLADHVSACVTPHGTVLLDLRRNKYVGLTPEDAALIENAVSGWPIRQYPGRDTCTAANDGSRKDAILRSMLEVRVLQRSAPTARGAGRCTVSLDRELASVGDEIVAETKARAAHVICFLYSYLSALVFLRLLPLEFTVRVVQKRKIRATAKGYCFDPHRAAQLTFVYRRLRPYLFSADGRCMIHALSLVNFMAMYGEFPYWVLGVRTEPWAAHSWVQHDELLFDTNPANVCPFIPIFCV
jgi:hypothetical protein